MKNIPFFFVKMLYVTVVYVYTIYIMLYKGVLCRTFFDMMYLFTCKTTKKFLNL